MPDGFEDDFAGELDAISNELERIRDLGDAVGNTLTRSLRGAVLEGRSLKTLLADIGLAFAQIALKAALAPVGNMVSGLVESVFAGLNPALGGASLTRGGGLSAPRYMPGEGQWGGANPVTPDGVRAAAAGLPGTSLPAAPGINVTFNVAARDAQSFATAEAEVSAMLLRAVKRGTRGT
ncbi:hypothetical protein [Pelagibacterium xiamenense]|uniref:hypothetical protein n=1 Tax=Pelagibacterium xiamenense TaxID=2901140 RepID=UPI001E5DECF5|nr:hypothetical protein [Pelagibacterium xiamenense]MCD7059497.1 hypothetical protein [Pelagibacterium xiamenense]